MEECECLLLIIKDNIASLFVFYFCLVVIDSFVLFKDVNQDHRIMRRPKTR